MHACYLSLIVQNIKGNLASWKTDSTFFIDFYNNLQLVEMHAAKEEQKKNPREANKEIHIS